MKEKRKTTWMGDAFKVCILSNVTLEDLGCLTDYPALTLLLGSCPTEAGSGALAGIISAVGVALFGAASSYFAYQKKKLCFKIQGG